MGVEQGKGWSGRLSQLLIINKEVEDKTILQIKVFTIE